MTRVCVLSEDLAGPPDEGIRKFASSLAEAWAALGPVLPLSIEENGDRHEGLAGLKTNRLLLSPSLASTLRQFRPDITCYVPSPSATLLSFIRSRILKSYWPRARVIMVALQPRSHGRVSRSLIPYLHPDEVLTQEEGNARYLARLGCHVRVIPCGVDTDRFAPVPPSVKTALRAKYGLSQDAFTVLHVGHIRKERNVGFLAQLKRAQDCQVILVGGASGGHDPGLAAWLRSNGVVVFDRFLPSVEEIYQLSDCYLFPVFSDEACIQIPLSVLEAMACGLTVVTVPFGGLPRLFKSGSGLFFAHSHEQLLESVALAGHAQGNHNREQVLAFSWDRVAREVLNGH